VPQIQVSPPFSLGPNDYRKLGKSLLLAMLGAAGGFVTTVALPELRDHVANDYGVLILTLVTALLPFLANLATKFLSDTTQIVKLILLTVTLTALTPCGLFAAEILGASTGPTGSVITDLLGNLTKDPLLMAALIIGGLLFASKVLNIDLSGFVMPLLVSLLKPPGPTPTPIPSPTPGPSPLPIPLPTPTDPTMAFLLQLLQQLFKAKASGDASQEAAASTLIQNLLNPKVLGSGSIRL
jgi:hypothetical protein